MPVLRKIFGISIAIAVALAVSDPSSAFAQAGGSAPAAPAQGGRVRAPKAVDQVAAAEVDPAGRSTPRHPVRRT